MKLKVRFISLEEDDKDLILSFAIEDEVLGVRSLILHRTLFFEELLDEEEKGVKVSLEGDYFEQEDSNTLNSIKIRADEINIKSTFKEYSLDITAIARKDVEEMVELLTKQNYDNRFTIDVT